MSNKTSKYALLRSYKGAIFKAGSMLRYMIERNGVSEYCFKCGNIANAVMHTRGYSIPLCASHAEKVLVETGQPLPASFPIKFDYTKPPRKTVAAGLPDIILPPAAWEPMSNEKEFADGDQFILKCCDHIIPYCDGQDILHCIYMAPCHADGSGRFVSVRCDSHSNQTVLEHTDIAAFIRISPQYPSAKS